VDDRRLDGNAVGGALSEVFALEVTAAVTTCAGCRSTSPVGALSAYTDGPGVVLRCPTCDRVQLRLVAGRGRYWLDLSGVSSMELRG
jgi:Zn finger protein HypA/HybF involved in hydrogenase expression